MVVETAHFSLSSIHIRQILQLILCPNAEFAKRHHMEDVLPVMCNCDHMAMQKLHATLIREGTCCTGTCCDYCIVGDQNLMANAYDLVKRENGLLVSVRSSAIDG